MALIIFKLNRIEGSPPGHGYCRVASEVIRGCGDGRPISQSVKLSRGRPFLWRPGSCAAGLGNPSVWHRVEPLPSLNRRRTSGVRVSVKLQGRSRGPPNHATAHPSNGRTCRPETVASSH